MSSHCVLDAWALMAEIEAEEPAASRVRAILADGRKGLLVLSISDITIGEVFYTVWKRHSRRLAEDALAMIHDLAVTRLPATWERVLAAARIKATHPISYADAFVVAAAQELGAALITGDPEIIARFRETLSIEELTRSKSPRP